MFGCAVPLSHYTSTAVRYYDDVDLDFTGIADHAIGQFKFYRFLYIALMVELFTENFINNSGEVRIIGNTHSVLPMIVGYCSCGTSDWAFLALASPS